MIKNAFEKCNKLLCDNYGKEKNGKDLIFNKN